MKNKSTIKDIFHGNKGDKETMQLPKKYFDNIESLCKIYDMLQEKLSPELLKLQEKFVSALEEMNSEEIDFFFVEGFKLGMRIGFECASD